MIAIEVISIAYLVIIGLNFLFAMILLRLRYRNTWSSSLNVCADIVDHRSRAKNNIILGFIPVMNFFILICLCLYTCWSVIVSLVDFFSGGKFLASMRLLMVECKIV